MASTPSKSHTISSPHEVLTLPEAAAFLRVSEETLSKLAAEQVLPARKVGEEWRFLKSALEDWLRQDMFTAGKWFDAAPRWLELLHRELLLAELERRLVHGTAAAEKRPAEPVPKSGFWNWPAAGKMIQRSMKCWRRFTSNAAGAGELGSGEEGDQETVASTCTI